MSETATMTLANFLLARILEDEAEATDHFDAPMGRGPFGTGYDDDSANVYSSHYLTIDPARVRAECDAKRAVLAEHSSDESGYCGDDNYGLHGCKWLMPCPTLRALALAYADHPDYREGWKP